MSRVARLGRLAPVAAAVALGGGCGVGVTCENNSVDFKHRPLPSGTLVATGTPTRRTTVFFPVAVPSPAVADVVTLTIRDDLDDPADTTKEQCEVLRATRKQAVLWYCQASDPFGAEDFSGGKPVDLPGGYRASLLPCEPTNLAWNKAGVGYSLFGDPAGYSPDEVVAIGRELARQDADPAAPKVGVVVASTRQAARATAG